MNIEFLIQNIKNGKVHDISQLVSDVEWVTDIDFQPGKLQFDLLMDKNVQVNHGDIIRFKVAGQGIFLGKVFVKKRSQKSVWSITAYDQMRYLKNEDTTVFGALPSHDVFAKICRDNELPYKIVDRSGWNVPATIQDKKSLFTMIQNALDLTLVHYGMWYIIRDRFGVLEHVALNSLVTKLVIGDYSLATDYDFQSSIDDAANQIKLTRDNKETAKREVYIVKDSQNINYWGKLQYHETVKENMNEAQIAKQAEMLLKAKNNETKTLKVGCIGDQSISAGSGIVLMLTDLEAEGFKKQQLAIVSKCSHKWGETHTMDLTLKVV
ncbi:hypothetical protein [Carnobacterium maltaromaticum]|uniref:XkdQ/YqbQ family protein n=2 Tax=Carnobacterium maltaromaticum TaxID=2751 RepID=UPI00191BAE22|nr:hypothetical protein [Carnobacterium maltaromaticum]CAD5900543.1 conserved hypothetical protein [Carnobacterium maltaromaticum]